MLKDYVVRPGNSSHYDSIYVLLQPISPAHDYNGSLNNTM
jgi:hypothetical protein